MTDSGTITREVVSTSTTIDPATGLYTDVGTITVIYSGICFVDEKRIQNPVSRTVGGDSPITDVASLLLPASSPLIKVQDIFVLDAAPDHPADVGLRFRITFVNPATQVKSRRCQMEAITG
jgi:hypothetical protein